MRCGDGIEDSGRWSHTRPPRASDEPDLSPPLTQLASGNVVSDSIRSERATLRLPQRSPTQARQPHGRLRASSSLRARPRRGATASSDLRFSAATLFSAALSSIRSIRYTRIKCLASHRRYRSTASNCTKTHSKEIASLPGASSSRPGPFPSTRLATTTKTDVSKRGTKSTTPAHQKSPAFATKRRKVNHRGSFSVRSTRSCACKSALSRGDAPRPNITPAADLPRCRFHASRFPLRVAASRSAISLP